MQWKVNRYGFDAKKWHSKENTLLHVEGDLIDNWIPLLHLMIFFFQSAVDYGRDCPKDLWLWHGLWYPDAHDKQQGECSMDGSWGLWRCACEKHYIFPFFVAGGGVHDANFAKLEVNLYCILLAHKFFVIWKWFKKLFKKEVRNCILYYCKKYHLNTRNVRQWIMIFSEIC